MNPGVYATTPSDHPLGGNPCMFMRWQYRLAIYWCSLDFSGAIYAMYWLQSHV